MFEIMKEKLINDKSKLTQDNVILQQELQKLSQQILLNSGAISYIDIQLKELENAPAQEEKNIKNNIENNKSL